VDSRRRTISIFNPENILDQFSESIPGAFAHDEDYLAAVARYVRGEGLPVSVDVRKESLGGIRAGKELFLVLTPVERRLRHYSTYHFGRQMGRTLTAGWYLLGKVAAGGLGGWAIAGGASQPDMDQLEALVRAVHEFAVIPAMHEIAAQVRTSDSNSRLGG